VAEGVAGVDDRVRVPPLREDTLAVRGTLGDGGATVDNDTKVCLRPTRARETTDHSIIG
jgi:hypothetical protein